MYIHVYIYNILCFSESVSIFFLANRYTCMLCLTFFRFSESLSVSEKYHKKGLYVCFSESASEKEIKRQEHSVKPV